MTHHSPRFAEHEELTMAELDRAVGGHRDRIRDAVLDLLRKMSEIKGVY